MSEQLASLVDKSNISPALPTGHPFQNVQATLSFRYWSATSSAFIPVDAWNVSFADGGLGGAPKGDRTYLYAWCVRGGQVYDGQDVLNAVPPATEP